MKKSSSKTVLGNQSALRGLPKDPRTNSVAGVSTAPPSDEQSLAGQVAVDKVSPSSAAVPRTGTTTKVQNNMKVSLERCAQLLQKRQHLLEHLPPTRAARCPATPVAILSTVSGYCPTSRSLRLRVSRSCWDATTRHRSGTRFSQYKMRYPQCHCKWTSRQPLQHHPYPRSCCRRIRHFYLFTRSNDA